MPHQPDWMALRRAPVGFSGCCISWSRPSATNRRCCSSLTAQRAALVVVMSWTIEAASTRPMSSLWLLEMEGNV